MGAKNTVQFSEADLDSLIVSVEGAIKLAKNFPPKEKEDGADPAAAAAPADADPTAGDPAAAAPAGAPAENAAAPDDGAAPAAAADGGAPGAPAEGAPAGEAGAPGEGAIAQEAQPGGEDAPLSDEELNEIYQSMPPEELERHYMIIRQHLQQAYAKAELDAEGANGGDIKPEGPRANPSAAAKDGPTGGNESAMGKSEEFAALQAKVANQDKALETIIKAFETFTKPSRKSVTGTIDYIRKSELDNGGNGAPGGPVDPSTLTKAEKVKVLSDIGPAALTKAERDQANAFILRGEYQAEVDKIISRGKK